MLLPFIISGLVSGGVYGLAGIGLVLTYKTSGVFNFAHGALATVAAYVFYTLSTEHGVAWPLAAAVAILVVGPLLGLALEVLTRNIGNESLAVQVAATVGIALAIEAVLVLIYGLGQTRVVPVFLSSGSTTIGSTHVQYSDLITLGVSLAATVGLYLMFRLTRTGTAMRAVVDDPSLLELTGESTVRVRRVAWLIGTMLASASGVLFAPLLPLDATTLTLLVVQAFGAAALGAFRSLPLTFTGGLGIGVVAALCTKWFTSGLLASVSPAVPFLVLFLVLLVFPKRYLGGVSRIKPVASTDWTAPAPLQVGMGLIVLTALAFVPSFAGIHLNDWAASLGTVILFLSLGLLVRTSGQVSLCHIGFAAIGVCAFSHFTTGQHVPWVPALLLAGLVAVPIGALLAIPAIRLTGLYLAIATFGFGIALTYMFYSQSFMFGGNGGGLLLHRPSVSWLGSDTGFYYVMLGATLAAAGFVLALTRGRLGRLLQAMSDSSRALTATGVSVNTTRVLVFCVSAFMASIAGALIGIGRGTVSVDSYPPLLSLTYLVLVVIVGGRAPWYALIAGLSLVMIPSYLPGTTTSYWLQLLFGVSAIGYALTPATARGVPLGIRRTIDRRFRRASAPARHARLEAAVPTPVASGGVGLSVHHVTVRFGGITAVNDLSLEVPEGKITGLIGPNGAGKTTLFNACSGLNRPTGAAITLNGRDVGRRGPAGRARLGLGRTFQQAELFGSLTVYENIALGCEGSIAGANPVSQVVTSAADRRRVTAAVWSAVELCGMDSLVDRSASDLSTGERRLVELARCVAGPFNILLLDEPSSGLDPAETHAFGDILERIVAERGVGILLVEHDMTLVMRLCAHIHVVDFGRQIFAGPPPEVQASQVVRDAYLGDTHLDDALAVTAGESAGAAR